MVLDGKPLESIDENILQELVDNKVPEGKTIEYKQNQPAIKDDEKKKFLIQISSFANASGGHLIYGMKEENGIPTDIIGIDIENPDAEKLRLDGIVRDGIDPRILGVNINIVSLETSKKVIVIRIPMSYNPPHMVTLKGGHRFYSRHSAGKYPLDVSELRTLFALSDTKAQCIRNFRVERLAKIVAGETPIPLNQGAKLVLNIVPFGAFDPHSKYDLSLIACQPQNLPQICDQGWDSRHNFDGFLTYNQDRNPPSGYSYVQLFRNGIIEAVDARILNMDDERIIRGVAYEIKLIDTLPRYLAVQKQIGVEPPVFIMLTLLGVSGYTMAVDFRVVFPQNTPIDRDSLVIPEIMLETFDCNPAEIMRQAFDSVWNATGWPRSMNYDENGNWVAQR